jgi:hypothetical protein
MSTRTPANCPHELRPGTAVCLHCLAIERQAARQRSRRTASRVAVLGVVAVVGTIAVGQVATALQSRSAAPSAGAPAGEPAAPLVADRAGEADVSEPAQPEPAPTAAMPTAGAAMAAVPASHPVLASLPAAPAASAPALRPRVGEGTSALGGGMRAERRGDTVTVHFDTDLNRTRRADKFEKIVRATLPRVYGAGAAQALATLPKGTLTAGHDLVGELPTRGVHLRLADGNTVSVWPTTRPGRDGPLVVTYRATVAR